MENGNGNGPKLTNGKWQLDVATKLQGLSNACGNLQDNVEALNQTLYGTPTDREHSITHQLQELRHDVARIKETAGRRTAAAYTVVAAIVVAIVMAFFKA